MRKSRRQVVNRIIEAVGVGLVALDLVAFFLVYKPLGQKLDAEISRDEELRQTVRNEQRRVDQLQKYKAAFPHAGKGLEDFTTNRTPSRREAYSTAAHLIHKVADAAGVQLTTMVYRLETDRHDPLERLGVEINAQAPYAGLLKFSHALETANEFILVRDFTVSPGGVSGALELRLGLDFYLTP
jgi:Tfp pilus assembly protein PilO